MLNIIRNERHIFWLIAREEMLVRRDDEIRDRWIDEDWEREKRVTEWERERERDREQEKTERDRGETEMWILIQREGEEKENE